MLDSSYIGKWFHVQSYKHDGSLHRTWDSAMIVDVTDDYIVIASTCNKVVEADGRHWYTREPAVSVFFFNDWFNFIAMFKDDEIIRITIKSVYNGSKYNDTCVSGIMLVKF